MDVHVDHGSEDGDSTQRHHEVHNKRQQQEEQDKDKQQKNKTQRKKRMEPSLKWRALGLEEYNAE